MVYFRRDDSLHRRCSDARHLGFSPVRIGRSAVGIAIGQRRLFRHGRRLRYCGIRRQSDGGVCILGSFRRAHRLRLFVDYSAEHDGGESKEKHYHYWDTSASCRRLRCRQWLGFLARLAIQPLVPLTRDGGWPAPPNRGRRSIRGRGARARNRNSRALALRASLHRLRYRVLIGALKSRADRN